MGKEIIKKKKFTKLSYLWFQIAEPFSFWAPGGGGKRGDSFIPRGSGVHPQLAG